MSSPPSSSPQPSHPPFAALSATVWLTLTAMVALGLAWLIVPHETVTDTRGLLLAAAVSWIAALLALAPVTLLGPLGVMATIWGYFIGAGGRIVLCVLAGAMLVKLAHLPAKSVMLTLVVMYLPLLMVEASLVARYLWLKDALAPPKSGQATGNGEKRLNVETAT